jgi:HD-GYP domain-containing protein (c-di-GMP phosphodiesterase class II)
MAAAGHGEPPPGTGWGNEARGDHQSIIDSPSLFLYRRGKIPHPEQKNQKEQLAAEMNDLRVNLWDLLSPLSKTMDMMSPTVGEHSLTVAYLSLRLCEILNLSPEETRDICFAAAIHDIGVFSLQEKLDILRFEETSPTKHAFAGYLLLNGFKPFEGIATMIRYHHLAWNSGQGQCCEGQPVPVGSHILHLADRVAVSILKNQAVLNQIPAIFAAIEKKRDSVFAPEIVAAFRELAKKDYIWLDIATSAGNAALYKHIGTHTTWIGIDELLAFAKIICRVIDFKSRFTAMHSSGVAAVATALAGLVGFSREDRRLIEISACFHDLGKLAIPSDILEKPGKLTPVEWDVMRSHVYYTHQILSPIESLKTVAIWGAFHQERLDGSGYPFCHTASDLAPGTRVMAVADVFTGITEERPYRKGMAKDRALATITEMARDNKLDAPLVEILIDHYDDINAIRICAQEKAIQEYRLFRKALQTL